MSTAELAVSYAALILADDGVEITVRAYLSPPQLNKGSRGCDEGRNIKEVEEKK
jgi:hypothetical protein